MLSPARWGEVELRRFAELTATSGQVKPTATGDKGMVVGTTRASAIRAGVEALRQGGSAMDAVCTTALAQIALSAGSTTSYAGIFFMVYHDNRTARTFALDAGYDAPLEEPTRSPYLVDRHQADGQLSFLASWPVLKRHTDALGGYPSRPYSNLQSTSPRRGSRLILIWLGTLVLRAQS